MSCTPYPDLTRRRWLRTGAAGLLPALGRARRVKPPNFLFIICDQLNLDALSAHGNPWVRTPNLDRLVASGVSFMESHTGNPLCSPARSVLLTGRTSQETGVINNSMRIKQGMPSMGQWFGQAGYETVYAGKWHLPGAGRQGLDGFSFIPLAGGEGDLADPLVALAAEAYFHQRSREKPFVFVASFLQPHDICTWSIDGFEQDLLPKTPPFHDLPRPLPGLSPNNQSRPRAPKVLDEKGPYRKDFTDEQWRYYLYCYYRLVEMFDADVGRLLDALEASGQADNTFVFLTADHGEGAGRHGHVQKLTPYDESVKVPFVVSCPKRVEAGLRDEVHLVSGLDLLSTMCDCAGIAAPPNARGRSLRPLLEGKRPEWREFVPIELRTIGRVIRTGRFKYVTYQGDPIEQLFDMKADPWEMQNLFENPHYANVVRKHRKLLQEWESKLIPA